MDAPDLEERHGDILSHIVHAIYCLDVEGELADVFDEVIYFEAKRNRSGMGDNARNDNMVCGHNTGENIWMSLR